MQPESPIMPTGNEREDKLSSLLMVISFLFPIVGVVLFFTKKETEPKSAKLALLLGIAGFALGIYLFLLRE